MSAYGRVSIVMPSYNCEKYIANGIRSVLAQSYEDWELIIVDDCSTDGTVEIAHSFDDARITYLSNDVNSGAAIARNKALRHAAGRWVAFLDSDDQWVPDKLQRQLSFMGKNNYAFTYTDYRTNLNGKWLPYINTAPDVVTLRKLYNWCYFSTTTVIYDRAVVGLIQIPDLRKHNDYAMWYQALGKTDAHRFPECLSYYIKHDGSISAGSRVDQVRHLYRLYRKGLGWGPMVSAALVGNNVVHGAVKKLRYRKYVDDTPTVPC